MPTSRQGRATPEPRRALSTERAIAVLNLMAAEPGNGFTLSELVARLDINIASMHAVLGVLMREGYVVRDRRRTYRLGFSPIAVGQAALDQQPAIQEARRAVSDLSQRLGLEVIGGVIAGSDLLVVAEAGRAERLAFRPRVGVRLPFMPPFAILGAGYLDEVRLDAWLDRLGPDAPRADRDAYREAALASRLRGYTVELETSNRQQIGLLMPELAQEPRSAALQARLLDLIRRLGHDRHTLGAPVAGETYEVNNIQAPIFDERGLCLGGLTLLGFDEPLDANRIANYVQALVLAADRTTLAGGGRRPLGGRPLPA